MKVINMKPRFTIIPLATVVLLGLATTLFASGKSNKLAVPSDAAQAEAMKTVKELFGEQWKKADDINAKRKLARSLLETAEKTHGDPPGRYVLLKVAKEVATMALDGQTAFRAVDLMAEDYQVDPVVMKADVLKRGAPAATLNDHHKALGIVALKQVEDAIAEDNYEVAGQLCEFAEAQARAAGDVPNVEKASTLRGDVEHFAQLYDRAQTALPKLKADPVNPEANRAVGEYLAFVKMQWDEALLMLALPGSDPSLRGMAEKELQELTVDQKSDLADAWWDMAERETGLSQKRIRSHALSFPYRKLLPQLTGLSRAKIEKRPRPGRAGGRSVRRSSAGRGCVHALALAVGNAAAERDD